MSDDIQARPYRELPEAHQRAINAVLGYSLVLKRYSFRYKWIVTEPRERTWFVYAYRGDNGAYAHTVEDHTTHYRVRGSERRDKWQTIPKTAQVVKA